MILCHGWRLLVVASGVAAPELIGVPGSDLGEYLRGRCAGGGRGDEKSPIVTTKALTTPRDARRYPQPPTHAFCLEALFDMI